MRLLYIIIISISIIITFLTVIKVSTEKNKVSSYLAKMLLFAGTAEIGNLFIAIPFYSSKVYILMSYALYFISVDWILYFLLGFCLCYTGGGEIKNKIGMKITFAIALLDTVNLASDFIFEHSYSYYLARNTYDREVYSYFTRYWPYQFHLIFDYLLIFIIIVTLVQGIQYEINFYKLKYIAPLTVLLTIVFFDGIYLLLGTPLDWSVLLYSVSGILIHFFAITYMPKTLMNRAIRETADDLKEGLILFDIDDKCIYVNQSAFEMFEVSESSCNTSVFPISSWITGKKLQFTKPYDEERILEKNGQEIIYKLRLKHITDSHGQYLGCYFLTYDITKEHNAMSALEIATAEAIAAREEATKASLAKGAFLANMSHEIRTPINAVLGMNEMILRENISPEVREYAQNIQISGDALLSLINDILDFSKIESGKMEMQPVNYKPFHVIRACQTMISPRVSAKDLELIVECDENCPSVLYGDEVRIRQVITNLLTNAAKYTEKGHIKIELKWIQGSEMAGTLVITVSDSGIGITEENKGKLFNAFERVDEKRNRNIEGTGLGLSITSELVRLMWGTISVESEYGKGSAFTVKLPQTIIEKTPSGKFNSKEDEEVKVYKEQFRAPRARILAVDDYKMNLVVLKGLLKKTEVKLDLASSGQEALDILSNKEYDLVLMDHMMPGMDGIETYSKLKEMNCVNSNIPVIMLTANAVSGAEKEYLSYGFCDYLSKPINGAKLEEKLKTHLPKELIEE